MRQDLPVKSGIPWIPVRGTGRVPDDELGVQKDRPDGNSVEKAGCRIVAAFSDIDPVLPYGGERRGSVGTDGEIVESDDT